MPVRTGLAVIIVLGAAAWGGCIYVAPIEAHKPAPKTISYDRIRELDVLPPEQQQRLARKARETLARLITKNDESRGINIYNKRWNGDTLSWQYDTLNGPWRLSVNIGALRRGGCYSMLASWKHTERTEWGVQVLTPDHRLATQGIYMSFDGLTRDEAEQMVDAFEVLGLPRGTR